jgi:hypothetical protein
MKVLQLAANSLTGPLPKEWTMMGKLRALHLE